MPESKDIRKIINKYFTGSLKEEYKYCNQLSMLFTKLSFTNPRHVKKVLNKFELLRRYKTITQDTLFPDIENNNNLLLIIFTLFLIVIHEFNFDKFKELINLDRRFESYCRYQQFVNRSQLIHKLHNESITTDKYLSEIKKNYDNNQISNSILNIFSDTTIHNSLLRTIYLFLPAAIRDYSIVPSAKYEEDDENVNNLYQAIDQFDNIGNELLVSFCRFLVFMFENKIQFCCDENNSFKISKLVEVIDVYL
jgi:hypothetical protein